MRPGGCSTHTEKREGPRDRELTQFTAKDLLQHEREKAIQAENVFKPAARLLHVNSFVLELCQRYCAGGKMTQVRSSGHMRVMCLTEAALLRMKDVGLDDLGACTDRLLSCQTAKFAVTRTTHASCANDAVSTSSV